MAKAKAILKRRRSVRNTAKITRTMQMIATAKFKKAMTQATATQPYAEKIAELAANLFEASGGEFSHPLLEPRAEVKNVALLVLTSNQGLCGGYNANIMRLARQTYLELESQGKNVSLHVIGKKGQQYFRFLERPMESVRTDIHDSVPFAEIEEMANRFIDEYSAHKIDEFRVVYTHFINTGTQVPVVDTLIPMKIAEPPADNVTPLTEARHGAHQYNVDYIFEPEPESILAELLPLSVQMNLYRTFVEAVASEQVARMVAMKGATDNADKLIKALTRMYNRARQTQITTEISEIVGGAAAIE